MKRILAMAVLVVGVGSAGCASLDKLYERKVTEVPGAAVRTNTVVVTNTVFVPGTTNLVIVTNIVGGPTIVTNVTAPEIRTVLTPVTTIDYAPATLVTNLVPRQFGTDVIGMAGALPIPFAGLASVLLGALYSGYAAVRNRKLAVALVTGIEAGRKVLQETPEGKVLDAKVRAALEQHQEWAGVANAASSLVGQYTGKTTG